MQTLSPIIVSPDQAAAVVDTAVPPDGGCDLPGFSCVLPAGPYVAEAVLLLQLVLHL